MKKNQISRRSFLERSATATTALAVGTMLQPARRLFAQAARPGYPVQFPPDLQGGTLTAAPAEIEVWPGQHSELYAINGTVPAPTIRVRRHHRFQAHVRNQLSEPLVLHWHGILSPASMDGNPRDAVGPGQSYSVDFPIHQQAGTYWYHAHTDLLTGKQVYLGSAGFFIVEDPSERHLRLPSGDHDLPLLIQDKRTHGEMHLAYEPEEMDIATGFLGDAVFVNNTPEPWLSVDRSLYRLRLLNGSNARVFRLGFHDERPFHLIANDAGLLPEPIEATTLMLGPGQRAEILVDFSGHALGDAAMLMSHPFEGGGHGEGGTGGEGGREEPHVPPQGDELPVLTFYVDRNGRGSSGAIPRRLDHFQSYRPEHARRTRVFNLDVDGLLHPINGALFDINRTDFTVPFGELETWEYVNHSDEFHPMHPHGALMQVLERHGLEHLPPEDLGWKDTVLVAPEETVRVLVRYHSYTGPYVHHCHNLEHEDNGMMQNLEAVPRRFHQRHHDQ
jgi:FtsP/CotA-like multicopper oxidase with cupredoxin domain